MADKRQLKDLISADMLEKIFSTFFQFIPIWIMFLIQSVSEYQFEFEEYIGAVLIFDITTCAITVPGILKKHNWSRKDLLMIILLFSLLCILCFSTVLYCLLLVDKLKNQMSLVALSAFFTAVVGIVNFLEETI